MAASPGLSLSWPVTFVTGNFNKMDEVKEIFGNSIPYQLLLRDLPEVQGDPLYICRKKAAVADAWVRGPVIVEVTSLCFNALNGLPGRYVKWFLKKNHPEGLNNILMAYEDKSAYALSVVAMVLEPETEPIIFHGKTMGKIVAARGNNGFGWDAIFQPDGFELTYAEMCKEEKNRISHRSISLSMAKSYLAGARYVLTSRE